MTTTAMIATTTTTATTSRTRALKARADRTRVIAADPGDRPFSKDERKDLVALVSSAGQPAAAQLAVRELLAVRGGRRTIRRSIRAMKAEALRAAGQGATLARPRPVSTALDRAVVGPVPTSEAQRQVLRHRVRRAPTPAEPLNDDTESPDFIISESEDAIAAEAAAADQRDHAPTAMQRISEHLAALRERDAAQTLTAPVERR